jgi:hypothetical protein
MLCSLLHCLPPSWEQHLFILILLPFFLLLFIVIYVPSKLMGIIQICMQRGLGVLESLGLPVSGLDQAANTQVAKALHKGRHPYTFQTCLGSR